METISFKTSLAKISCYLLDAITRCFLPICFCRQTLQLTEFWTISTAVLLKVNKWRLSGVAKVSCILRHRGVQLILAYSWARPAILVAGKDSGGMFSFLLFLHFHSCSSFFPVLLFHLLYNLFYLFSPVLWEMTQNDTQRLTCG